MKVIRIAGGRKTGCGTQTVTRSESDHRWSIINLMFVEDTFFCFLQIGKTLSSLTQKRPCCVTNNYSRIRRTATYHRQNNKSHGMEFRLRLLKLLAVVPYRIRTDQGPQLKAWLNRWNTIDNNRDNRARSPTRACFEKKRLRPTLNPPLATLRKEYTSTAQLHHGNIVTAATASFRHNDAQ